MSSWIKMRTNLFTHPKVVRMSSALKADVLQTVGGLMSVWSLFDEHTIDGKLSGYRSENIDTHLRWPGFTQAMIGIGWLNDDGESLSVPEWTTHNGQSAKRRAQEADRKKEERRVQKESASDADKKRTRKEKNRSNKERDAGARDEDDSPPPATPRAAGLLAAEVRKALGPQCGFSSTHPDVIAGADEGVTSTELLEVHAAHPGKPVMYALAIARDHRKRGPAAARGSPPRDTRPAADFTQATYTGTPNDQLPPELAN